MKKALFVMNPGSGKQDFWKDVEDIIGCLALNAIVNHVDVIYTEKQYDAKKATEKLKYGQYDVIVAVGGDGTISDVVNGVIKSGCRIPVAVLPMGTSNAFATALNLPSGKEDFCRMLRKFTTTDIDVGRINGQYFVSTVSGGIGADISYKAASDSKMIFGKKAYFYEGLLSFPKQLRKSMKLYVDSEEYTAHTDAVMFYISNAGGIAGNKKLLAENDMNDGLLNVAVFQRISLFQFASLFWKFIRGKPLNHPKLKSFNTKKIKIQNTAKKPVTVSFDGEMFGTLPIEVECLPKAVKIVIP